MADWSMASRPGSNPGTAGAGHALSAYLAAPDAMAREIFLDELNTDAVVLPRIVALGDIDEDELAFAQAYPRPESAAAGNFPRDLDGLAAPPAAGATDCLLGEADQARGRRAGAAGARRAGFHAGDGRRSRAPDGRHGDLQVSRGTPSTGWCRMPLDRSWQLTLRFLNHRRDLMAGSSSRAWPHRAGRAARSADRCRGHPADRAS